MRDWQAPPDPQGGRGRAALALPGITVTGKLVRVFPPVPLNGQPEPPLELDQGLRARPRLWSSTRR